MLRSNLFTCTVFVAAVPAWAASVCSASDPSCFESEGDLSLSLSLLQKQAKMLKSEPNTEPEVKIKSECIFHEAGDLGTPFLKCCSAENLQQGIECAIDIAAFVCGRKYPLALQFQTNQCAYNMVRDVVEPPDGRSLLPVSLKYIVETIEEEETAYINILRHGEKCAPVVPGVLNNSVGHDNLTTVGAQRSKYLTRCVSKDAPSLALPFGKPTAVMCHDVNICGRHGAETIGPLAQALNLTVGASIYDPEDGQNITVQEAWRIANSDLPSDLIPACGIPLDHSTYASLTPAEVEAHDKTQLDCVIANARARLSNKGTVIYQIVYQTAPEVLSRMAIPNLPKKYNMWPLSCPNPAWAEPECAARDVNLWHGWNDTEFPYEPVSMCFDVIWQIKHTRPNRISEWKAQSIETMYEGFAGDPDAVCAGDLAAV